VCAPPPTLTEDPAGVYVETAAAPTASSQANHRKHVVLEVPATHCALIEALAEFAMDVVPATADVTRQPTLERGEPVREAAPRRRGQRRRQRGIVIAGKVTLAATQHAALDLRVARAATLDDGSRQISRRHQIPL
jgi:hypothetical protein